MPGSAAVLDRLTEAYGQIRVVTHESGLAVVGRDALLDRTRVEDWILFLAV
jgi:hypothetical protein